MKKILLPLTMILLVSSFCFSAIVPSFDQKSECMLVDLASTIYVRHTNNPVWASGQAPASPSPNKYYDNQIITVIGIVGDRQKTSDVTLSAELLSGQWAYILDGDDTRYMRPFGIQIIGRRKENLSASGTHTNLGTSYNIYMGGSSTGTTSSVTVPQNIASLYEGIWWDVVLVFDNNVNTETDTVLGADGNTYNLVSSDHYYSAILKLTITWGTEDADSATYTIYLNGTYKYSNSSSDPTSGGMICNLNVDKLASGNSVDIRTLFNSYSGSASASSQSKTLVATYNFTTNTGSGKKTGNVSMFLSSVSNGLNGAQAKFILRHVNADGSTSYRDTNHNSLKFYAYLDSTRGHSSSESNSILGTSVEFDGTSYFATGISGEYLVIEPDTYKDQDGGWHTRWHDTGTISVAIPSTQSIDENAVDIDGLIAGQYTSNIYVHVVTNF